MRWKPDILGFSMLIVHVQEMSQERFVICNFHNVNIDFIFVQFETIQHTIKYKLGSLSVRIRIQLFFREGKWNSPRHLILEFFGKVQNPRRLSAHRGKFRQDG